MKNIEYDSSQPLKRLEKGDKAIITVTRYYNSDDKYKDIPEGKYEAICVKPFHLRCSQYPVLSGAYNEWVGDKWGSAHYGSVYIKADEIN